MATIILQAAGAFIGGVFGPLGSAIGSAAGAMVGYALDRSLIEGTRRVEGPRLGAMQPFMAEEGAPIPRVYGTARIGGNMIWATRFEEDQHTERQGAKGGGPRVTTYSYFCNAAFALCEGPIAGVRRIWADGRELDLEQVTIRVHRGTEDQPADPLIAARQGSGNAPAYRGVAYVVLERFPVGAYGNRIPQMQFEVLRPVGELNTQVRSVALLPGSTEYGLLPRPVTRSRRPGETLQINRNILHARSDLVASLDELQALCPNLEEVAIVAAWFGTDLRAGSCQIRPAVVDKGLTGYSEAWSVSGVSRSDAAAVSLVDSAASYGGTPSDRSVVECIAEIRSRGLRVALYPFVMMDIPPDNTLPNPYGGSAQPAFPWRGRVTCHPASGRPGSADRTAAARAQIEAFCGGASDWGYRRLILHYAQLAAAAGGVDSFLIGSEMRALTTLRDEANAFPFVEALCGLAADVRSILGPNAGITYGADWSEYFGYQPTDGSGDVFFHLDPLWAHEAVTAVGIDSYMPLSDWRDGDIDGGNPDGFVEPYDREGLRSQVAAGEGYDWYYANDAARLTRTRSAITDGAYGKPWVFRYKDIKSWWENRHYERVGGVEKSAPTAWQPRAKPVWLTELGCPAVDKGPNQPNAFPDAKSSENTLPYFSSGGRSDVAQARFIGAHMEHWIPGSPHFAAAQNPVSPVYGGRMVTPSRLTLWAWDARPFPAYPARQDLWRDSSNWHRGHWLNGRLSSATVGDLIAAILLDHGLEDFDTRFVGGSVSGYVIGAPTTARAALEPLAGLYGISVRDDAGRLTFRDEATALSETVEIDDIVVEEAIATIEKTRAPDGDLPREAELAYADPFLDYQSAVARIALPRANTGRTHRLVFPGYLEEGAALALLDDWVQRMWAGRDGVSFSVPATAIDITPGARISLPEGGQAVDYHVTNVDIGLSRRVSARRVLSGVPKPWRLGASPAVPGAPVIAGKPHALLLDLPVMPGSGAPEDQFRLAAYAKPWRSQAVYVSAEEEGFALAGTASRQATLGHLVEAIEGGPEGRIDRAGSVIVELYGGSLSSVSQMQFMNGANAAAIRSDDGGWEVMQFADAGEIAPSRWRLTRLLRGQCGTADAAEAGAAAGAPFVILNEAVARAGLRPEQAGLLLNWRIGPVGHEFGGETFAALQAIGGVRARLPLSPVHLRVARRAGGDAAISWIRRGRIDADSWLADDIPLGEESERYRVEVAPAGGAVVKTVEVAVPGWVYPRAEMIADLPLGTTQLDITVRQISAAIGAGLPVRGRFPITLPE